MAPPFVRRAARKLGFAKRKNPTDPSLAKTTEHRQTGQSCSIDVSFTFYQNTVISLQSLI
jgi:hypothetical protein